MLLSVLLTMGAVAVINHYVEWNSVFNILKAGRKDLLGLAFLCFIANYAIRTFRIQMLTTETTDRYFSFFAVTSLYGFFNYIMPFRTGELSYPLMLKKRLGISLADGAASLMTARFFDLATIAVILPLVFMGVYSRIPRWLLISGVLYCLLIGSFALLFFKLVKTNAFRGGIPFTKGRFGAFLSKVILAVQKIQEKNRYILVWFCTLLIWGCIYLNFYFIVVAMGYRVSLTQMVVVSILSVPISLIPFQGFANLGTHELAWVTAFSLYGRKGKEAVEMAVNAHLVLFFLVIVLGLIGWLLFIVVPKNSERS